MKEKRNFLCNVLMDIADKFTITYNYTSNDLSILPVELLSLYDYNTIKNKSTQIELDNNQSEIEENTNTKWKIHFDSKRLLREYLYNEIYMINPYSFFNNIPSNLVPSDKISELVYQYIDNNLLDKYQVKEFILWTKYFPLNFNTVPGTGGSNINPVINLLSKTPVFSYHAIPLSNVMDQKRVITKKQFENGNYIINYKQSKSSQFETFIYYYDVIFEKI
jgi:hypothetical protein